MGRRRERRRGGRREKKAADPAASQIAKINQPLHKIPPYELVSAEGLELVNDKSLEILSDVGVDYYDDEAQAILKAHGVKMKGDTAFFDREMIEEYVAKAPSQFTQIARNPANNVVIGGKHQCFAPVYGPPFVHDLDRGRREATLKDFQNFVKLAYSSPYMHHSGGTICEPTDIPAHTRHLDMIYSHIKYSNKAFMGSVTTGENAADSVKMCEILYGADKIRENPAMVSLINVSSPRRYDDRMLGAMKEYSRAKQGMIISPFLFSGAMAPVGLAGTLIQLNAEALAGIVLTQMINPGTPVIFGAFQTNIDLQSGAPVFGSPESQITLYAAGQLARRHGLPYRNGGMFSSSKIPDAQAAYESVMVMKAAVLAHVNFVLHAAGWLEAGLAAGYEKFVMDCELLGMFHVLANGLDLSENGLAMDSLRNVDVTDHHLGTEHTMKNFRTAFFRAEGMDYNSYEQWYEEGHTSAAQRANGRWKKILREYKRPELDPAIDEALQEFMAKRRTEIKPDY
ncbi:MAG: trimethylamine methyltransferase family protein [Chloroflexota bacterium]